MWPDDYIDWARRTQPEALQQSGDRLQRLLERNPLLSLEVNRLAGEAVREAFNKANERQHFPAYFETESQFRLWLAVVVLREEHRLLLQHEDVRPYLGRLSADQRRLLGMWFLDDLPAGDLAAVLQVSADEVRRRYQEALQAFWALLR
jgi:DNA-directed RNA polymerase specialized sigma24 family protein